MTGADTLASSCFCLLALMVACSEGGWGQAGEVACSSGGGKVGGDRRSERPPIWLVQSLVSFPASGRSYNDGDKHGKERPSSERPPLIDEIIHLPAPALSLRTCAAASRAMGTRRGEQET